MVIEKVHGIHATGLSLNERFSLLSNAAPDRVARQRKRRSSAGSIISQNYNYSNRLIEQVARRLEMQTKRLAMRQRIGNQQTGGFRRFGSESSLPGLKRSNSFGNLSQLSVKSRVSWKQSNNNLSRSASFNNLTNLAWRGKALRGFRKRGGAQRALRVRFRGGKQGVLRQNGQVNGFQQRYRFQQRLGVQQPRGVQQRRGMQQRRGVQQRIGFQRQGFQQRRGAQQRRGGQQRRGAQRMNQRQNNGQQQNNGQDSGTQGQQPQRPQVARRGGARGRGRGGITRSQSQSRLLLTKDQLDAQLDQYMSCTKAALDLELDNYMKNAMELE